MDFMDKTQTQLKTDFAFSSNGLNRNATRRGDKRWVESLRCSNNSRFVLFSDNKVVVLDRENTQHIYFTLGEAVNN